MRSVRRNAGRKSFGFESAPTFRSTSKKKKKNRFFFNFEKPLTWEGKGNGKT